MRHDHFLDLAIKAAFGSNCRHRHGAVVVSGGRILSVGINIQKNDPAIVPHSSVHAEVVALRRARWPKHADIYCGRISASGKPALSKPCGKCQAILDAHGYESFWSIGEEK